jgi:hypothetical protein
MYRILAALIAAFAAALTLGTGPAAADPPGDGHNEHCGHGSFDDCDPPDECENKDGRPMECPPLPPIPNPNLYNVIVGSPLADVLFGSLQQDAIFGRAGNDRIRGRAGNDLLFGMVGNDIIRGGLGTDRISGGRGRDLCIGDNNDQFLQCERVVVLGG